MLSRDLMVPIGVWCIHPPPSVRAVTAPNEVHNGVALLADLRVSAAPEVAL